MVDVVLPHPDNGLSQSRIWDLVLALDLLLRIVNDNANSSIEWDLTGEKTGNIEVHREDSVNPKPSVRAYGLLEAMWIKVWGACRTAGM